MHTIGCNCSMFCRGKTAEATETRRQAEFRAKRGHHEKPEMTIDEALLIMQAIAGGYVADRGGH